MITAGLAIAAAAMLQPGGAAPTPPSPLPAPPAAGTAVQLRNQLSGIAGDVAAVSYAGVLVRVSAEDAGKLISWDRVRKLEGVGAEKAEPFRAFSDSLMRARTRLERGDVWLADQAIDPLYQEALADGDGRFAGPSGLLLAECMLRSTLARNATAGATLAWMHWSAADRQRPRSGSSGSGPPGPVWVGGTTNLPPVVDAATGLCPQLPPIFPHRSAVSVGTLRLLSQSPELARLAAESSPARTYAVAYLLAVRIAGGDISTGESAALPTPSGEGEQLVFDVVAAQTAPSEPMRSARARLLRRLESLQRDAETRESGDDAPAVDRSWQRAWIHAAVGRSLMAEDQPAQRRQGMIELLHVPALDGNSQPGLAATALMDVIDQLRRDGGNETAISALSSELKTRFGIDPSSLEPMPPAAPAPAAPASDQTEPSSPVKESP